MFEALNVAISMLIVYAFCAFIVGMGKGTKGIDTKNNRGDHMLVGAICLIVMFENTLDILLYVTALLQ